MASVGVQKSEKVIMGPAHLEPLALLGAPRNSSPFPDRLSLSQKSTPAHAQGIVYRSRWILFGVLGVHALLLTQLLNPPAAPLAMTPPKALTVSLIPHQVEPSKPVPPRQKVAPPAPSKSAPKKLPTVSASKPVAPAAIAIAPAAIAPSAPVLEAPTEPKQDALPAQFSPAPPPAVEVAPLPLLPPRFNADYLDNPKPPYPALSQRLREEGEVRLRVWVDADGAATRVALFRSSGFERLDRIAIETVQRWRFTPARQGDQAVAAQVIVPVTFNLKD